MPVIALSMRAGLMVIQTGTVDSLPSAAFYTYY